jgi:hypothetical protein
VQIISPVLQKVRKLLLKLTTLEPKLEENEVGLIRLAKKKLICRKSKLLKLTLNIIWKTTTRVKQRIE